jgi:RNA polymerase sigma-70 factor (ECF subfamily)
MPDELDGELLKRFVQGDREAFEALFRQFEHDVFRWALWIVREPATAEDVVVEAFWRAYRARARFDPSRSFGAWMRRIATNVARDHLRAARPHTGWRWSAATDQLPAPAAADTSLSDAVAIALGRLPPKLQVIAALALVEDLPHAEIADAMDLPIGTVKSRLFRAVRALRKELASLGIQP